MIQNEFEALFSSEESLDHQLIIFTSDGRVLTNEDIAQESVEIEETLCADIPLQIGSCEASCFKMRVITSESLKGRRIDVRLRIGEAVDDDILDEAGNSITDENGEPLTSSTELFKVGTYYVKSDVPTADRVYHDIVAYDSIEAVLNADLTAWYNNVFGIRNLKIRDFRNELFAYLGITQQSVALINDDLYIKKSIDTSCTTVTGKMLIEGICELNGVFGHINREDIFVYISLSDGSPVKTYDRYIEGSITYQNYITAPINNISYQGKKLNNRDNAYGINTMLYSGIVDKERLLTRLLDKIDSIQYRPFTGSTYGDLCIEVGDKISIPTMYETVTSYVFNRNIHGIQALTDSFITEAEEKLADISNGIYSTLEDIQGSPVVKIDVDGTLVNCAMGEDTSLGNNIKIQGKNIAFIADGELDLTANELKITSDNFSVDENGKMSCSSADITGGSIHMETSSGEEDSITLNYTHESDFAEYNKEINSATLTPKGIYASTFEVSDTLVSAYQHQSFIGLAKHGASGPEVSVASGTPSEYISKGPYYPTAYKFWANNYESGFRVPVVMTDNLTVMGTIYNGSGEVITSDRDAKMEIEELSKEDSSSFIYALKPSKFKLKDGTSGRFHHGLIAQEVKEVMKEDSGLYVEQDTDAHTGCGLRYEELIADLIATVQKQHEEIEDLKKRLEE